MRNAKLLVPAGGLTHDNCGETLSPTQFALFGAFALLLATFVGIIWPSLKVVELNSKIFACAFAVSLAHQDARTSPVARNACPINRFMLLLPAAFLPSRECSGRHDEIKASATRRNHKSLM